MIFSIIQVDHGENQQQAAQEKQQQVEDMRNSILSQVLDQSARARCKNLFFFF